MNQVHSHQRSYLPHRPGDLGDGRFPSLPGFHLEGREHYRESYAIEIGEWRIASLHLTGTWLNMRQGTAALEMQVQDDQISRGRS